MSAREKTTAAAYRQFENRIRKWRQLRFGFVDSAHLIPPRRSASSDPKRFTGECFVVAQLHQQALHPRIDPQTHFPSGVVRVRWLGRLVVTLNFNGPSQAQRELDEIERRYEAVKRNSGILRFIRKFKTGEMVKADFHELEFISDIGNGSCGHVSKMSYKGHVMAVKDMARTSNKEDNKRIIMDLDTSVKVCMEVMASCLHTLLRNANRMGIRIAEGYIGKMSVSIIQALDYLKDHLNYGSGAFFSMDEKNLFVHRIITQAQASMDET
ncbi:hypothetical protein ANCDUO_12476 [Ancylostoma duodenale]|uniref:Protein kinase domain-containing protein n=1 Tax=Ancylostoma duodenale TaxID=51022 RepID=A0A0C2GEJ7_9BILA|nr:hypothetical protein ANCDUO_12476 [Ancylostoma duodenale]